jgi:hypothetical protein
LANLALPAQSGLAAVSLARGDVATALDHVRGIQARLAGGASLDGLDEPLRLLPRAAAAAEPEADAELRRAHDELQALAGRLTDPEHRQRLLGAVPVHRAIVEAYDAFRLRA